MQSRILFSYIMDEIIEKLYNINDIYNILDDEDKNKLAGQLNIINTSINEIENILAVIELSQEKNQQIIDDNNKLRKICKSLFPYYLSINESINESADEPTSN